MTSTDGGNGNHPGGPSHDQAAVDSNLRLWNQWADLHVTSEFYDVDGFLADPGSRPLDPIVLDLVGVVTGVRLLHLQCHFGLDTLRFALMGAYVTGVDFSENAIRAARELSERSDIPATFVQSDVRSLPSEIEENSFDVVFTSYGTITWLPELTAWADTVASRLKPGGRFYIVDMHPTLWIFDDEGADPSLRVRYSYFGGDALRFEYKGSYAVPDADVTSVEHSWQHNFEDILGALLGAGLEIDALKEYAQLAWQYVPFMIRDDEGFWVLPEGMPEIPLMFSIAARKPA
jgi:SAM-dependent methyltransferase